MELEYFLASGFMNLLVKNPTNLMLFGNGLNFIHKFNEFSQKNKFTKETNLTPLFDIYHSTKA